MSDVAVRRMTLDEFLLWDDGTDTRYELISGCPVAMAPGMEDHGVLAARLAARLENALISRRPCRAIAEAGILDPDRADTFFVVDIGVTCAPREPRRQYMQDPMLLVEILSPSTERRDRKVKVPAYQRIPSVQEILLVDSDSRYAEIHRRQGEQWIIQIINKPEGTIPLASVGIEIPMSELYEGFTFGDDPEA
ncbi:MAG: Uma2 family endonuclease [Alphaproteobacteria bacterium]